MVCKDDGKIKLKFLDEGTDGIIRSRLYTGAFNYSAQFSLKQIASVQLCVSDVKRDTTINIYYRPRGYPNFTLAGTSDVRSINGYGRYTMLNIPIENSSGCDPVTGESLSTSDEFQFCIEWIGNLKIDKFKTICSLIGSGPRLTDQLNTGDGETFPGIDLESTDFDHTGSQS